MWTWTEVLKKSAMTLEKGNASTTLNTTLNGAWLGLLKDNIGLTDGSTTADITGHEATFDGYTKKAITWTGPFIGEGDTSLLQGGAQLFQPTGSATVNTVYGQFLLGSDSSTLLAFEMYNSPIPLADANAGFVVVPMTGIPNPSQGFGNSIVSNI
jgi:hypothetical protein